MSLKEVKNDAAPRELDEINKEYTALCARAGQLQYQIRCYKEDLEALNKAIRELNTEAAKSQQYQKDQEAKAAAERGEYSKEPAKESTNA